MLEIHAICYVENRFVHLSTCLREFCRKSWSFHALGPYTSTCNSLMKLTKYHPLKASNYISEGKTAHKRTGWRSASRENRNVSRTMIGTVFVALVKFSS